MPAGESRREASHHWLTRPVGAVIFATLALGLLVPDLAGAALLLLALTGLVWLPLARPGRGLPLTGPERLVIFAVLAWVGVWTVAWLGHGPTGISADNAGLPGRLLLIIPVLLLVRGLDGLEPYWWRGLTAGALIAGGYAAWFYFSGQVGEFDHRPAGVTSPIYFGAISLILGMALVPRVTDERVAGAERALAALGVIMAFAACTLAATRGVWPAIPLLVALYLFTLGSGQRPLWRFGLPAALLAMSLVLLFAPGLPMHDRLADALGEWQLIRNGEYSGGALGLRWEMWRVAAQMIQAHPLAGSGPHAFATTLREAVAAGELAPELAAFKHPHNQYFSALLMSGVAGLAAFCLLLVLPALRAIRHWQALLPGNRSRAWCALTVVVIFAVLALTESFFERNPGVIWFAFLVAVTLGLARPGIGAGDQPRRRHSLSVIVICKNEADRIGRCLESVAGWADEIVVLDSGSDDNTVAICRRYTDRVEVTDWPGFGIQKQRALDRAGCDWVLSLDADEWLSPALRAEIDQALSLDRPAVSGYQLTWLTHAFGGRLRHGRWARAPLRLFARRQGRFTPSKVHEKVVLTAGARSARLEAPLHHATFRDVAHARAKLGDYARLQGEARAQAGRRVRRLEPELRAAINWIDNYLLRAAFLDGRRGWTMSRLYAGYTRHKYRLTRSLDNAAARRPERS